MRYVILWLIVTVISGIIWFEGNDYIIPIYALFMTGLIVYLRRKFK